MANEGKEPAKDPHAPRCPHCGSDPLRVNAKNVILPEGTVILLVWCAAPECRKTITASFREQAVPTILPAGRGRIIQ